jgi:hypothetical protein
MGGACQGWRRVIYYAATLRKEERKHRAAHVVIGDSSKKGSLIRGGNLNTLISRFCMGGACQGWRRVIYYAATLLKEEHIHRAAHVVIGDSSKKGSLIRGENMNTLVSRFCMGGACQGVEASHILRGDSS